MVQEGKIWIGSREDGTRVYLLPEMAARHGLIAGATGTGKTVTLKVLSEAFSDLGVPVFLSDVKGDLAGMVSPAADSEDMQRRIQKFGLAQAGFEYKGYPAEFFDIYGKRGIQLRTTVSEMGPLLLSRILGLNDTQSALLSIAFQIADAENLLLIDIKDLKALLNFINDNRKVYESSYGRISPASIAVIIRSLAALEGAGGNRFFGETAFDIRDFLRTDQDGRGIISILDSSSLIANGTLYSTFLLWLLSELFDCLTARRRHCLIKSDRWSSLSVPRASAFTSARRIRKTFRTAYWRSWGIRSSTRSAHIRLPNRRRYGLRQTLSGRIPRLIPMKQCFRSALERHLFLFSGRTVFRESPKRSLFSLRRAESAQSMI